MINLTNVQQSNFTFFNPKSLIPTKLLENKVALVATAALLLLVACLFLLKHKCFNKKASVPPKNDTDTVSDLGKSALTNRSQPNDPEKTTLSPPPPNDWDLEIPIDLPPVKDPKEDPTATSQPLQKDLENSKPKDTTSDPTEPTTTDQGTDTNMDAKRTPDWMNAHPDTSFTDLGMTTFDDIEGFLKVHGQQLECLNLGSFACNNDEFKKLVAHCPQLKILSVSSNNITNCALSNLKGKPLKSISCKGSEKLSHKALKHIKELATLTSVDFSGCKKLTDFSIKHLSELALTDVNFNGCDKLTDKALEHLKKMPLISVDFDGCSQMTSKAVDEFKEMLKKNANNPSNPLDVSLPSTETPGLIDNPESPSTDNNKDATPQETNPSEKTPDKEKTEKWSFWSFFSGWGG